MRSSSTSTRFAVVLAFFLFVLFAIAKFDPVTQADTKSAMLAPAITATKAISFPAGAGGDVNGDGNADPGDTITYTVTVNNTAPVGAGNDATGMVITDTLQNITTLVGMSVNTGPLTTNDAYNVTGNVSISVPDGASDLLANDIDPDTGNGTALTVVTTSTTSANCAPATCPANNVTIAGNGSFTYNPPPGFEGTDTFTYTVRDNGADGVGGNADDATAIGTVTLNISGMVWFINNNAAACTTLAGGCGRLSNPFSTLAAFQALNNGSGNNPSLNDNIFIYESATAYTGGVTLLGNQRLIGQDSTSSLSAITFITLPPFSAAFPTMNPGGTATTIQNAGGNGVTLNNGAFSNALNGFTAGNSSGFAIGGSSFGNVVVGDVTINTTGAGLSLATGAVAGTGFTSVTTAGGANGVTLTSVTGTVALGSGALSGATGTTFNVGTTAVAGSGGTADITYSGTITQATSGQRPVSVQRRTGGSLTLNGLITATAASGIFLDQNGGSTITFSGGMNLSTGTNAAFTATGGGTVNVCDEDPCNPAATGAKVNSLTTTTGIALNVTSTTIGANNLEFRSISASGAANGIVLNNSGVTGSLKVTGSGSVAQGGDNSGGTLQNTTGDAISLTNTTAPSFNNVNIQSALGNGVFGTQVTNFSFTNGKINNVGDASGESCLSFSTLNGLNVSGTFTFTNNQCTLVEAEGVDIKNYGGTISNVNISNNVFSDTGDVATAGSAVVLTVNSTAAANSILTKATLNNNTITDFRAGAGFVLQGNSFVGGSTAVTYGTANDATNNVTVSGNLMNGGNGGIGNQPDRFITGALNGRGTAAFVVSNNGTLANPIQKIDGVGIELSNFGPGTMSSTVNNNRLAVNNAVASAGIGIGCDIDSDGTTVDIGLLTLIVDGNFVSQTDGQGIFAIARNSTCILNARITNNTAAAPATTSAARSGIQVSSGSAVGDTTLCSDIRTNVTAGSTNTATVTTAPGISIRKQGTVQTTNDFGIEGLAPSPATAIQAETYVSGQNPGSTAGTFGTGGTASLSGANYQTCASAPNRPTELEEASWAVPTREQDEALTAYLLSRPSEQPINLSDDELLKRISPPAIPDFYDDRAPQWYPTFMKQENSGPVSLNTPKTHISSKLDSFESAFVQDLTDLESQQLFGEGNRIALTETAAAAAQPDAELDPGTELNSNESSVYGMLTRLAKMISPTAYAQTDERSKGRTPNAPEAGETITVNGGGPGFTLAAGKSVTVTFKASVNNGPFASGINNITNTANVTAAGGINVNTNTTSLALDAAPDLIVTVSDGSTTTQPGVVLAYNVSYSNATAVNGQNVSNARISQTVPTNTTFNATVSGAGWSCPNGSAAGTVCTFDVGAVNAGAPAAALNFAVNVLAALPAGAVQISDTATIAENPVNANGTDRNTADNSSTDTTNIIGNWDGSTSTDWNVATNWSNDVLPPAGNNVSIPNVANQPTVTSVDVTLNNLVLNGGNLSIATGRTVTVNGSTILGTNIVSGLGMLNLGTAATISRTTGQVNSTLQKNFSGPGPATFVFPVGTTGQYSPVDLANVTGAGQLSVRANTGLAPATPVGLNPGTTLQRYWTLEGSGITSDITWHYLQTDVAGNELAYNIVRVPITGSPVARFAPNGTTRILDTTNNFFTITGMTVYSYWTAGEPVGPTAAPAEVTGRVSNGEGRGVSGAVLEMVGQEGNIVYATTNPFGYYRFAGVQPGQTYIVSVRSKHYTFAPRVIGVNESVNGIDFNPEP